MLLFLGDEDADRLAGAVDEMLAGRLPGMFRGYPVAFGVTRDPGIGVRHRRAGTADQVIDSTPVLGDLLPDRYMSVLGAGGTQT
jgi:hypothetical protein